MYITAPSPPYESLLEYIYMYAYVFTYIHMYIHVHIHIHIHDSTSSATRISAKHKHVFILNSNFLCQGVHDSIVNTFPFPLFNVYAGTLLNYCSCALLLQLAFCFDSNTCNTTTPLCPPHVSVSRRSGKLASRRLLNSIAAPANFCCGGIDSSSLVLNLMTNISLYLYISICCTYIYIL